MRFRSQRRAFATALFNWGAVYNLESVAAAWHDSDYAAIHYSTAHARWWTIIPI